MSAVAATSPIEVTAIATRRFGDVTVPVDQLLSFPDGLPGFEGLVGFALLPIRPGLAWLQSTERADVAFLLVEPGRVVAGAWHTLPNAWAVVTLGGASHPATANLVAPIGIDPITRVGRQMIRPESGFGTAHAFDLGVA